MDCRQLHRMHRKPRHARRIVSAGVVVAVVSLPAVLPAGAATRKRADASTCARMAAIVLLSTAKISELDEELGQRGADPAWSSDLARSSAMRSRQTAELESMRASMSAGRANFLRLMVAVGCDPATGKPSAPKVMPTEPVVTVGTVPPPITVTDAPECAILQRQRDQLLAGLLVVEAARAEMRDPGSQASGLLVTLAAEAAKYQPVGLDPKTKRVVAASQLSALQRAVATWAEQYKTAWQRVIADYDAYTDALNDADKQLIASGCATAEALASPTVPPVTTTITTAPKATTTTKKGSTVSVRSVTVVFDTSSPTSADASVSSSVARDLVGTYYCDPRPVQVSPSGALSGSCDTYSTFSSDAYPWTLTGTLDLQGGTATVHQEVTVRNQFSKASWTTRVTLDGTARTSSSNASTVVMKGTATYGYSCQGTGTLDDGSPACGISTNKGTVPLTVTVTR